MMEIADTEMGACKESPCDIQSPEGISKSTSNEIDREGVNEGVHSLSVSGDDGSKENATKNSVDEDTREEPSHEDLNDRSAFEANGSHQDDDVNLIFLREKLSAALQKVSIKDELVKQHSKVAEEAVLGWEKAEKETVALKQQLDAAVESKSALESRVSHLDEALKECVRQLRLGREEQEMSITQAVAERTVNLEAAKTELEDQLIELQERVENCRVHSPDLELQDKVESLERENIYLKQQLQTLFEELEVRSIERDLSTKAAETASKQHLESINKVARLEAECRKLKSRMSSSNDHAASSYVDSLSQSHSGSWASSVLINEVDHFKSDKVTDKSLHSSKEINLMDDFLEMERLAGLPDTRPLVLDDCNQTFEKPSPSKENKLKVELKSLEESLGRVEADKAELQLALAQTQSCLDNSEVQLREAQLKLERLEIDLHGVIEGEQFYKTMAVNLEEEAKLMSSQIMSLRGEMTRERALSEEKESRIVQLEGELKEKEEEMKLKDVALAETRVWLEMSEAQLRGTEAKVKGRDLSEEKASRIEQLEGELKEKEEEVKLKDVALAETRVLLEMSEAQLRETEAKVKERALSEEKASRVEQLEGELKEKEDEGKLNDVALSEMRVLLEMSEAQLRETEAKVKELENDLHKAIEEKESLNSELDNVRAQIDSASEAQMRETEAKVKELEKDLHKAIEEKEFLNSELDNVRAQIDSTSEAQMRETEAKVKELEKDLHKAIEEKESLNSELDNVLAQVDSTSTQIDSLTRQVREKQCLEVQFSTKVKELERMSLENESLNRKVQKEEALVAELSTQVKELERELQQKRVELEARQRAHSDPERKIKQEELAAAAAGKLADCQKTIASLGNQLNSLAALEDFLIDTACIPPAPLMVDRRNSDDPWKLHSNDTFLAEKRLEAFASHSGRDPQASSVSSTFFLNHSDHGKVENGFAKYFSVSRN